MTYAPPTTLPGGTVTFLFTDIEGSTRLWEEHPRAMQAALALHDALLRASIENQGGYIFKTMGDQFCAAFSNPPDAVMAAITAQRALRAANWDTTGPLSIRAALYTGHAEPKAGDYFGPPVNRVARILSSAHGGQVLLSTSTEQLVRHTLPTGTNLKELGHISMKGISQPECVYQLIAPGLSADFPPLPGLFKDDLPGGDATHTHPPLHSHTGPLSAHNPYKGLRAFHERDAEDFFGRETLTERLLGRLGEAGHMCRFLAVVGPSGSGKSSVVRAGLVPALRHGAIPGSERWLIVEMIPGARPLEELEALLLRLAVNPPETLINQLREDERGLVRAAKRILPDDERVELMLVIDQFEEIFTLVPDEPTRVHFLESLCNAVKDPRSRIRLVITLRADFYDRPLLYPDPGELVRQRTEVVLPLNAEELERAITKPALKSGAHIQPELLASMIKDVSEQPGALPLLQYALTELFNRRGGPDGNTMTLQAYRESGGVSGALARRADEIYQGLNEQEREATRQMFLRLVTLGEGVEDTRRRVRRDELETLSSDRAAMDHAIDEYGRYRLLTFDRDPVAHTPTVEVAHEALIRSWGRLKEWLDSSRSDLRVHRQLASATAEWMHAERDPSFLARGSRLAQFQALSETGGAGKVALNQEELDYLQDSLVQRDKERAATRRRVRLAITGLVAALAAISLFAVLAVVQAGIASEQAHAATQQRSVALSREIAAESLTQVKGDSMRSLLLGVEAARISPTDESENAIRQALLELQPPHVLYQGHEASGSMDFSPDSKRVVIAEHIGPVRIRDVNSGDILAELDHKDLVDSILFSPDGKLIAGGSRDRLVWIWDGQTGKVAYKLEGHEAPVFSVAFSDDSKQVVSAAADKTARVWDAINGKPLAVLNGHTDAVNTARFSPDGKRIVTASDDKTARVWDASTGKQLFELDGHQSIVNTAVFSPDGKWILTASQDNTARLWDAGTGKVVAVLGEHTDVVNNARFSPDGKTLVTASNDGKARLWDLAAVQKAAAAGQSPVSSMILETGPAMDARFSLDGKWLVATCSNPGNGHQWVARVFDAATGKPVAEMGGHEYVNAPYGRAFPAARFSPDGKWLLVADGHSIGRVLQWEFYEPLSYLLTIVPRYATRQLTCEERQVYLHEGNACGTPAASPAPTASVAP